MLVYVYTKKNPHIFLGTTEYDENSKRSLFEINATTIKPPQIASGEIAIYDIVRKAWTVINDYRIQPIVDNYNELRRSIYPPLEVFADAMVHNYNGDPTPLQEYYDLCTAIKKKYPKG